MAKVTLHELQTANTTPPERPGFFYLHLPVLDGSLPVLHHHAQRRHSTRLFRSLGSTVYQLTVNKPTAQPSCCKGAFLLQGPYGFFVLCFTEIARFVVVKRPRCAKGHRHSFARFLAVEATSTQTAPVTQNLRISTSAAHSSSGYQLNRFVPHVLITTNSAIALVRLAQALLPTGRFWLVFILLGPMHPFEPLSQVLQVSFLADSNHEFHSSMCFHDRFRNSGVQPSQCKIGADMTPASSSMRTFNASFVAC